jgi:transposase-like protein
VAHANARLTPAGRSILCQRIAAGRPAAQVAAEMGISRTCAYRWWGRYQQHGRAGLHDRPSTAHHHPHQVPAAVEAEICRLRRTHKLGPARIAPRVGRPASTVQRGLVRHGLNRLALMDRPTGRVICRYERARPGELVHIDVKKLGRIPDGGGHRVHGRSPTTPLHGVGGSATTTSTQRSTTTPGWPTPRSWLTSTPAPAPDSGVEPKASTPPMASPSSGC